jgi:membrane-bound ClpP family serine protease
MGWWLVFAIFLYLMCAALLVAEVFVPSGGLITIIAIMCLIAGLVIFFKHSIIVGWIGVFIAVVMIPAALIIAYKLFPKTKFGKGIMLNPPERQAGDAIPDTDKLKGLLGKEGLVVTTLRPVGMCDFSGLRVECVSESGYVGKGKMVKVIDVKGTQLTVRVVEKE